MHTRQAYIYALAHSLLTNLTSLSWSKQSQINTCWQIITLKIKGQYFKITSFKSIESKYQKINNQMECGLDSRIPSHLHSTYETCYRSPALVCNLHIYATFHNATALLHRSHLSLLFKYGNFQNMLL